MCSTLRYTHAVIFQIQTFPCLSPRTLKHHLSLACTDTPSSTLNLNKKKVKESPSSILSEWVAEDILNGNTHIEFRSAVSLLSNKIVRSPSLVSGMPQVLKKTIKNIGTTSNSLLCPPTNNLNNSCNVMYTKLSRAQSLGVRSVNVSASTPRDFCVRNPSTAK